MQNYQLNFRLDRKTIYPSPLSLCLILGIAHGFADAVAAFLLGRLPHTMSFEQASGLFILYNVLGFGYQPLVGMLTDKFKCPRLAVLVGLSLHLLALLVKDGHSQMAIILAGIGSATFHVGGGSLALTTTPYKTIGSGLFTAPGIIGLAVGGILGFTGNNITIPIVILLGLTIWIISLINLSKYDLLSHDRIENEATENDNSGDGVLLVLLIAMALTSTVWTSFQLILQNHFNIIIVLAFATAITKVGGGVFAELWGWRRYTIVSLTIVAFLLLVGQHNHLTLILGLALLQSTVPITLAATAKIMPQQPATATGFALGLSILIGGIPVIGGLSAIAGIPAVSASIVIVSALSLWWVLQSKMMCGDA